MAEIIECVKCGNKMPGLEKAPFGSELGQKIYKEVCAGCWKSWTATQNQLINHYGLSTIDPEHQEFLIQNLESFLFGKGMGAIIDTSLQGKVSH